MVRKLAIFVEGQTESLFIAKLVEQIAGERRVKMVRSEARGGRNALRRLRIVELSTGQEQDFYVLIVDCGSDKAVKSDIRDRYEGLARSGYSGIIGIRDVYPEFSYGEIPKLRRGLRCGLPSAPIEVSIALAIMEIEAWFIAEHTHFSRIHPKLSSALVRERLGFDPAVEEAALRPHPAADLANIYRLAGRSYSKRKATVERTVDALDYARVYAEMGERIPDLQAVLNRIDCFLA